METTTTPTITLDHAGLNDAERQTALALMRALDAYRAERGCPPSALVTLHAKDVAVSQTIAERMESMLFERMAIPLAQVPAALFDAVGRARDRHRKALTAFTLCVEAPLAGQDPAPGPMPAEPQRTTPMPQPRPAPATACPKIPAQGEASPTPESARPRPRERQSPDWRTPRDRQIPRESAQRTASPSSPPQDPPSHRFPMNAPKGAP